VVVNHRCYLSHWNMKDVQRKPVTIQYICTFIILNDSPHIFLGTKLLTLKTSGIHLLWQYACFQSCQFRTSFSCPDIWNVWQTTSCIYVITVTTSTSVLVYFCYRTQWGTEHQYLFSRFLGVSILQLLIIYHIYGYDMLTLLQ
jgi:hypothetical protein